MVGGGRRITGQFIQFKFSDLISAPWVMSAKRLAFNTHLFLFVCVCVAGTPEDHPHPFCPIHSWFSCGCQAFETAIETRHLMSDYRDRVVDKWEKMKRWRWASGGGGGGGGWPFSYIHINIYVHIYATEEEYEEEEEEERATGCEKKAVDGNGSLGLV